jgi:hypothetical protein
LLSQPMMHLSTCSKTAPAAARSKRIQRALLFE